MCGARSTGREEAFRCVCAASLPWMSTLDGGGGRDAFQVIIAWDNLGAA